MKSCAKTNDDQWLLEDVLRWVKNTYGTEQHKKYPIPIIDACMISAYTIIHTTGDYKLATVACLNECLVGQDRKKYDKWDFIDLFGAHITLLLIKRYNTFLINSIITKHIVNKGLTEEDKERYNSIIDCLDNCPPELIDRCKDVLK